MSLINKELPSAPGRHNYEQGRVFAIQGLMDDIRDQKYLLRHMMKTKLEIKMSLLRGMNMGIISHEGGDVHGRPCRGEYEISLQRDLGGKWRLSLHSITKGSGIRKCMVYLKGMCSDLGSSGESESGLNITIYVVPAGVNWALGIPSTSNCFQFAERHDGHPWDIVDLFQAAELTS